MTLQWWSISLLSKKCHNHRLQNNPWHFNDGLPLYCPRNATITDFRKIRGTSKMIYLSTVQEMPQSQTSEKSVALQRWSISLLSKKCHNHRLHSNLWHFKDDLSLYCPRNATITDYTTIHGTSMIIYCLLSKKWHTYRPQSNPWHFNDGLSLYCPRNATITDYTTIHGTSMIIYCLLSKKWHTYRPQSNPWHFNDGLSLYCPRNATITDYKAIHDTPMMIYLSTVQEMPQSQTTEQSMALQRWFISRLSKKCHNIRLHNNPWHCNDDLSLYCPRNATLTDHRAIHGISMIIYIFTVQ